MLGGLEGVGEHVNALGGHAGEVIVGLDKVEVANVALWVAVIAVEDELVGGEDIVAVALVEGVGVGEVNPVVECLGSGAVLETPDVEDNWVIEATVADVDGGGVSANLSGGNLLNLLDEVFVGELGKATALLGVEEKVVGEEADTNGWRRATTSLVNDGLGDWEEGSLSNNWDD